MTPLKAYRVETVSETIHVVVYRTEAGGYFAELCAPSQPGRTFRVGFPLPTPWSRLPDHSLRTLLENCLEQIEPEFGRPIEVRPIAFDQATACMPGWQPVAAALARAVPK